MRREDKVTFALLDEAQRLVDSNAITDYIDSANSSTEVTMASLTIRKIEDELKATLRLEAAKHGRSMEEEARQILRRSLVRERATGGLGSRVAARFAAIGGIELPPTHRALPRPAPQLDGEEQ